jgi:hypothetical protein
MPGGRALGSQNSVALQRDWAKNQTIHTGKRYVPTTEGECSRSRTGKVIKLGPDPVELKEPLYIFNNSWYVRAPLVAGGRAKFRAWNTNAEGEVSPWSAERPSAPETDSPMQSFEPFWQGSEPTVPPASSRRATCVSLGGSWIGVENAISSWTAPSLAHSAAPVCHQTSRHCQKYKSVHR